MVTIHYYSAFHVIYIFDLWESTFQYIFPYIKGNTRIFALYIPLSLPSRCCRGDIKTVINMTRSPRKRLFSHVSRRVSMPFLGPDDILSRFQKNTTAPTDHDHIPRRAHPEGISFFPIWTLCLHNTRNFRTIYFFPKQKKMIFNRFQVQIFILGKFDIKSIFRQNQTDKIII